MDAGQLPNTGVRSNSYEDHMSAAAGLEFVTDGSSTAHFVATIGWHVSELSDGAKQLLQPGKIDAILDGKAALYQELRPHIQGLFQWCSGGDWQLDVLEHALCSLDSADFPEH